MHKNLTFSKTKGDKPEKTEEKKATKKCRIAAGRRQEKGLQLAKVSKICCGNDTGKSVFYSKHIPNKCLPMNRVNKTNENRRYDEKIRDIRTNIEKTK